MAEMLSSLDSESKDESPASSIKTVDLADDTTSERFPARNDVSTGEIPCNKIMREQERFPARN
ncbi:hypothetical protein Gotur_025964, partial [Gossypium turneri]